jgi:hypothetical protein
MGLLVPTALRLDSHLGRPEPLMRQNQKARCHGYLRAKFPSRVSSTAESITTSTLFPALGHGASPVRQREVNIYFVHGWDRAPIYPASDEAMVR